MYVSQSQCCNERAHIEVQCRAEDGRPIQILLGCGRGTIYMAFTEAEADRLCELLGQALVDLCAVEVNKNGNS